MQRDYLFRHKRSSRWWIRFVYPKEMGEKETRRSLGTPDRMKAELIALPLIQAHKERLWAYQNEKAGRVAYTGDVQFIHPLGSHTLEDGTRVFATTSTVLFIRDDQVIKEETNQVAHMITYTFDPTRPAAPLPPPERSEQDEAIIRTWIRDRRISAPLQREVWNVWAVLQTQTGNKPLKECTRDDGRRLAQHFIDLGEKSATVQKKVGHLRAAVKIAIAEGKLSHNPFSEVVPRIHDRTKRLPLSEADMKLVRSRFGELSREDQALWIWLACTGMRRGEPFQIREEFWEQGCRYVIVGSKTESSERRVPVPDSVLPYLPEIIAKPLFTDSEKNIGRHLNRFIRRVGIVDERKVLHSLRHRAKDRLRAIGCPHEIQLALLGHDEKTVADDYGKGYPIDMLKHWMEQIGW